MFIDQETLKEVNIAYPYKGRSRLDTPEIRAEVGVIEIPDPQPPQDALDNPDHYFCTTTGDQMPPYKVWTKRSDEQIAALELVKKKAQRQVAVDNIKVTVSTGKEFDGNEDAIRRLTSTLKAADITGLTECVWVLANDEPTPVTKAELEEALALSVQVMGAIWAEPYL